jgi:ceramide glucosyltransferase
MFLIAALLGWIALSAALCGALYALAALWALPRFAQARHADAPAYPAVTLLKPLHGAEPDLRRNLESFCCQEYPAPVQLLFGVQHPADPAIPLVEALKAAHPELDIELLCTTGRVASNPKIDNLLGLIPRAAHSVLVVSDSDIGVPPDYLRKVVGALEQYGVGAVTCCYVGNASDNRWSRMAAMGIDYQFLPSVICSTAVGLAMPCFGSTIALRRDLLDDIGGFEAFADELADDYEIGYAVRARGLRVALPPLVVTHSCPESSAAAFFRHEVRWARTIRSVDPIGYVGGVVTHMLPLGMLGTLLLDFSPPSLFVLGTAMAARLAMKHQVDRCFGLRSGALWLLPQRDVLSFVVFVIGFFSTRVDWRGQRYQVNASGALVRE